LPGSCKVSAAGQPARVVRVRDSASPLVLLVVTDLTGDMTLVDPAMQALTTEINGLSESSWAAVLRSQDGLQVVADPSADRAKTVEALKAIQVTGRAGLLETVEPAATLAAAMIARSPVRLAILYITDSNITNYREDYTNPVINYSDTRDLSRRFPEALIREKTSKLAESLAATPAPVFIVHLSYLRDRLNEAYQTGLQQMAQSTGGDATICRTLAEIPTAIADAFSRIGAHWAIDFQLAGETPASFDIAIECEGGEVRHRIRFSSRRGK
jgi:hypothetical protein